MSTQTKPAVTPGPWIVHQKPFGSREYGHHVIAEGGLTVCQVTYQLPVLVEGEVVERERIANARLIADAGTTYHLTGKPPSELAAEVERLERAGEAAFEAMRKSQAEAARLAKDRDALLEACKTFEEWLRREDAGFIGVVYHGSRDTTEGEAAWSEWYGENYRLCAVAQEQARAAIHQCEGAKA